MPPILPGEIEDQQRGSGDMNDQTTTILRTDDISQVLGLGVKARSHAAVRKLLWIAAALFTVAATYYLWGSATQTPATQYKTAAITKGDLSVIVTATGTVEPTIQVDISSELSGTVRKVLVDYNDSVRVGQTLAELDTDKLNATAESSRAKLAAAKAKVADAEATLEEKRIDYTRKRDLYRKKISSEADLDSARAALARAEAAIKSTKADVVAAEADLKLDETNLSKTRIVSPINGVVLARSVEPGQTVASSLQAPVLFTIAEDLSKMEVEVDVDEADVGQVQVGQNAEFSVDAYPERHFPAKIRSLHYGSETVSGVVTYMAVLTADNSDLLLRPGMTATAEIRVQEVKDALLVPNEALRFVPTSSEETADNRSFLQKLMPGPPRRRTSKNDNNGKHKKAGSTVHVLRDGEAVKVEVNIGPSDGRNTQIVKGDLKVDDRVILDTVTGS